MERVRGDAPGDNRRLRAAFSAAQVPGCDGSAAEPQVHASGAAHRVGYAFGRALEKATPPRPRMRRWIVAGDRRFPLSEGENVIGRDPASAVWLDAAGVSCRHARIVVGHPDAVLEDLGSKNGTTVRDELLTGPVTLRDADRIRIGPILIVYHASPAGLSTETMIDGAAV